MLLAPKALSEKTLSRDILSADKKNALRFGPCSLGKAALYLGGWYFDNTCYIPLKSVNRVYKRLAVSKGFYEGKPFGTIPYLVMAYDDGRERVCRFRHEEDVDRLLDAIRKSTEIPVGKP